MSTKDLELQQLQEFKKMKVVVICFAEMGHFIPCINLGGALSDRGHDVTAIVSKVGKEMTEKVIADSGCKAYITDDDCERIDMAPLKGMAG